jgi:hypothetical protein
MNSSQPKKCTGLKRLSEFSHGKSSDLCKERAYVEVLLAFTTILQQLGIALKGSMKSGIGN